MGLLRLAVACFVGAMLQAFLRADTTTITTVPVLNTPYWVAVRGHLPDQVRTDLEALDEVEIVSPTNCFSFIGCSQITIHLQYILVVAGLEFYTEANQQIHTQSIRLEPYEFVGGVGGIAGVENRARQEPVEVEDSVPWNLDRIDQLSATLNGIYNPPNNAPNVDMYILDTGVNLPHIEFGGRASRVTAFKDEAPCTSTAHGTWVASIAAGGFYGVARQANIYDMKLPTGSSCDFYTSDAAAALNYLLLNVDTPFIVVMSWSAPNTPALNAILQDLNTKGAILINAAGNEGSGSFPCSRSPGSSGVTYPVASVDQSLSRSSFSNFGSCVKSFAPGKEIVGAGLGSTTQLVQGDGTSASCPMEAGRAAVLMTQLGLTTPTAVYNALNTYSQKNVVTNAGSGSPNRFCNFKGSGSSPSPSPATPTPTRASPRPSPASAPTPSPPAGAASKFNVFIG